MADEGDAVSRAEDHLLERGADIVAAYVSHNALRVADLPQLIMDIHQALKRLSAPRQGDVVEAVRPAVPIRKSITADYLICLEDGRPFKSLKRHLRAQYDLSPAAYREKWGLPADYPMVAPTYSATRSRLAKDAGLGRRRGRS